MAQAKPRILYKSVINQAYLVDGVWASHEEDDAPGVNAATWHPGQKWTPKTHNNLLNQGGDPVRDPFMLWSAGVSSAPDGWTVVGAGATIAQESTTVKTGTGPYSAALTRAGTNCYLQNVIADPTTYRRKKVTAGSWINTAVVGSAAAVVIADSASSTTSTDNDADGDWDWHYATHTVASTATTLHLRLRMNTADGVVYFSGPQLVIGSEVEETPHPDTAYLYVVQADGQEVQNWRLDEWANGPSSPPDGWTRTGAGSSTYLTMANSPKVGPYAMGLTRAGTDCYHAYPMSASFLARAAGRKISGGIWGWASVASRAYFEIAITLSDGATVQLHTSTAHGGTSAQVWLEKEGVPVPPDATAIEIRTSCKTGDTSVEFNGPIVVIGETVDQTPHVFSFDTIALSGHNLATHGRSYLVEYSSDQVTWSTALAAQTPTTDHVIFGTFTEVTDTPYARIGIVGGLGTGQCSIGNIALGLSLELPEFPPEPFDIMGETISGPVLESGSGQPLDRTVKPSQLEFTIEQMWLTEDVAIDTREFLDYAGTNLVLGQPGTGKAKPFYYSWDPGDHGSWTESGRKGGPVLAWIKGGARVTCPYVAGLDVERLSVPVLAVSR